MKGRKTSGAEDEIKDQIRRIKNDYVGCGKLSQLKIKNLIISQSFRSEKIYKLIFIKKPNYFVKFFQS